MKLNWQRRRRQPFIFCGLFHKVLHDISSTLRQSNIAMENPPFEDVFPIQDEDFPLLCLFTGG